MMEKLAMLEALKDWKRTSHGEGPPPRKLMEQLREARGLKSLEELDREREEAANPPRERSRSREREAPPRNTVTQQVMEWNPATGEMEAATVDVDMGAAAEATPAGTAEQRAGAPDAAPASASAAEDTASAPNARERALRA